MSLRKSAVGNLINRYKSVLKKCNLMNVFGTLAIASMLVAGSVSMATATVNNSTDWTTDSGKDIIYDNSGSISIVTGGTVDSVTVDGDTTGGATFDTTLDSTISDSLKIIQGVFALTTGVDASNLISLTVNGLTTLGDGVATVSTLDLGDFTTFTAKGGLTFNSGIISVTGTAIDKDALLVIGGDAGLTLNNDNAKLNLSDATLITKKLDVTGTASADDAERLIIMRTNIIQADTVSFGNVSTATEETVKIGTGTDQTTKLTIKNTAGDGYGDLTMGNISGGFETLDVGTLNITAGKFLVNGTADGTATKNLIMDSYTGDIAFGGGDTGSARITITEDAGDRTFTNHDGSIGYKLGGTANIVESTATGLTDTKNYIYVDVTGTGTDNVLSAGILDFSDVKNNIIDFDNTKVAFYGISMNFKEGATFTDGKITLYAHDDIDFLGGKDLKISSADAILTLTVPDSRGHGDDVTSAGEIQFSGTGGKLKIENYEQRYFEVAGIKAVSNGAIGSVDIVNASLRLKDDTSLVLQKGSAGGLSVTVGDGTDANYGSLTFTENSTFAASDFATVAVEGEKIGINKGSVEFSKKLTLDSNAGQTLTIDGGISAASLAVTKTTSAGTVAGNLTIAAGNLIVANDPYQDSTIDDSISADTITVNSTGELQFGYFYARSAIVGDIDANLITDGTGGIISVEEGSWAMAAGKTIDIKAGGHLEIGATEGGSNAKLMLGNTKGQLVSNVTSSASVGVSILKGGSLWGGLNTFVSTDDDGDTYEIDDTIKNKLYAANGGVVYLNEGSATLDKLNDIKNAILVADSGGLATSASFDVIITAADKISGSTNDKINGTVKGSKVENLEVTLADKTIGYDGTANDTNKTSQTLTGGYGAKNIAIGTNNTAAPSDYEVEIVAGTDKNLTLVGDGENLINVYNKDGSKEVAAENVNIIVSTGGLQLGLAGSNGGGTLGNIDVSAANTSITAAGNGIFKVGAIEGNATNSKVGVESGATLNADSIGGTNKVNAIETSTGGSLNVTGDVKTGTLTASGGYMYLATGIDKTVTVTDITSITGGAIVRVAGTLDLGGDVTVGSATEKDSTGGLSVKTLAGTGTVFADPAWRSDKGAVHETSYASQVAVGGFSNTSTDAAKVTVDFVAGNAGQIALGTENRSWLESRINYAGDWGNGDGMIDAAFGVTKAMTLTTGSINVDGKLTSIGSGYTALSDGNAVFADNSLFVIDADGLRTDGAKLTDSTVALTGKTIIVKSGAKLLLSNVKAGDKVIVTASNSGGSIADGAWSNATDTNKEDTLFFDNIFMDGKWLTGTGSGGNLTVEIIQHSASSILPELDHSLGGLIDAAMDAGIVSVNSPNAGGRFLALASNMANNNPTQAAATIEGATKLGVTGGVASSITSIGSAGSTNAGVRTSIAGTYVANATSVNYDGETVQLSAVAGSAEGMQSGFGLWIMPMYQNHSAKGLESGNFEYGYDTDFYGVSIGADYTVANNFRFGAAFNIGAGTSDSSGDFNKTENDFDYYGFSAYAGYHFNNIGISADLGYTISNNDIDQSTDIGSLSADSDAYLFTAGLRAEYVLQTTALDIIPHVGIRVNSLNIDSFDTDFGGGTAFKTDSSHSTTVQFPIGLTLAKTFETSGGWNISPSADVGVMFTTGDIAIDQDVRIPGVATSASMESDVYDATTFQGGLGISMAKDNFSIALDYNLNASEHITSHGVFGTLRYEF